MDPGGISKSQIGRLCMALNERVDVFLSRPLERAWPCLWFDATYLKVRGGGRIIDKAMLLAVPPVTQPPHV